jgi:hypothetical protein
MYEYGNALSFVIIDNKNNDYESESPRHIQPIISLVKSHLMPVCPTPQTPDFR